VSVKQYQQAYRGDGSVDAEVQAAFAVRDRILEVHPGYLHKESTPSCGRKETAPRCGREILRCRVCCAGFLCTDIGTEPSGLYASKLDRSRTTQRARL